ncbi:helix-turn-helix domain-containing protein [Pantoea sp. FN060301]|uniref:helix-turn-helix domain-containing protein n=1 Tax=Pantoea sp. FN060301 TaxID=3420380 RepID=UPI003D174C7F
MIEFITDSAGKRKAAIVPIELFEKMVQNSDLPELWEPVPYAAGKNDDAFIPGEVVDISIQKGVTLHAAWRLYRGLTQKQVAEALNITQASVSAMEKSEKPRELNLQKLADLYNCQPEQLTDD